MDFLRRHTIGRITPERLALLIVAIIAAGFLFWIAEQNVAFFGSRTTVVRDFTNVPPSVTLIGKTTFDRFSDSFGTASKPNQDRSIFQFTFPRGFVSARTELFYQSDPAQVVVLTAAAQPGEESQRWEYRHPDSIPSTFSPFEVPGGRAYLSQAPSASESVWDKLEKSKNIVAIGPNALALMQPPVGGAVVAKQVVIPFILRGSAVISAFLPEGEQEVYFTKRDLNYADGEDTYTFRIRGVQGRILRHRIEDDGNVPGRAQEQATQLKVSVPQSGLYEFEFLANNEDSTIENLTFIGSEVSVQAPVFFGARQQPVHFYTTCGALKVEAVKASGLQEVTIGADRLRVSVAKQEYSWSTTRSDTRKITLPKGDISVRGACTLQLTEEQSYRKMVQSLQEKVTVLSQLETSKIAKADAILDSYRVPDVRGSSLVAHAEFKLVDLSARGRAFTFEVQTPGYATRSDANLRFLQYRLEAIRPVLHF